MRNSSSLTLFENEVLTIQDLVFTCLYGRNAKTEKLKNLVVLIPNPVLGVQTTFLN